MRTIESIGELIKELEEEKIAEEKLEEEQEISEESQKDR